ncbi:hypothetical protein CO2235_10129 [Cupriavidus oxalaticus]|uniref:Uncharacterized protein n=1 Tax=Cupriavidus oxalaticus TaxID=96344 RepID=A0A976G8F5_9BURK|nr:hypothetical protein CO2235_10129 [Cupriavidus oxalaticus]
MMLTGGAQATSLVPPLCIYL